MRPYFSYRAVTDGAKLFTRAFKRLGVALCGVCAVAACERSTAAPSYDPDTRLVRRIDYDTDRDGRIEARVYYAGGRAVRLEADSDADGVIDRWEQYDEAGGPPRVGTSSLRDGRADTWALARGAQVEVEISTRRDGAVDRREFHDNGALVRTEQDTNFDGQIDQWQRFEQGRLRELDLDSTFAAGRPDRRLVYAANGTLEQVGSVAP
jgi:hypothetical protein